MTDLPNLFEVEARMGRISRETYEMANKEADAAQAGVVFCYLVSLGLFAVGVGDVLARKWSAAAPFIVTALALYYGYRQCRAREHKFRLISMAFLQRDQMQSCFEDVSEETPTKNVKVKH